MLKRKETVEYGEKRILGESFGNAKQVYDHFHVRLGTAKQEEFNILILDNKHRVIEEKMITLGTLNQSLIHPREVFAPAIELRAAAIILVHCHPSGDTKPSKQDIEITKRLAKLFDPVGSATWYLTEYDPVEKIAFCYVVGLQVEWGYCSLEDLESGIAGDLR